MVETSRIAQLRDLGAEIVEARKRAGLNQRQLAEKAGISTHSRISEMESGKRLLPQDELERILEALAIPGADRERLLSKARAATGPGQLNTGVLAINSTLAQLIDLERSAVRIVNAAPLLVPGLLQTGDYARAVIGSESGSELMVKLRSGRQDILTRARKPVELVALIDSEALVRPVVPPDMMLHQLRHIVAMANRPNVTVQVVSSTLTGYNPMLAGPFELIEPEKADKTVLLDHHSSSVFLWKRDDVDRFVAATEEIRKVAMTPTRSVEVISEIIKGMEQT